MAASLIGTNVTVTETDKAIVLTIAKDGEKHPSQSGKTLILGTTHGGKRVGSNGNEVTVSVNAYVKNPNYVKDVKA